MTKIKMLVMGALMTGMVAVSAPASADHTVEHKTSLHSEYGYQNDHSAKKMVAEPKMFKKEHHKKKHQMKKNHMKKKKKMMKKHAEASHHNYPNECNKPPCNGTSN